MVNRPCRYFIGILLIIPVLTGSFETQTIPDSPNRWITDRAGFLSPDTIAALDQKLESFETSTGHQFIVYIDRTTQGYPIEDWAVRAFETWKIGKKGSDDGLALFIMTEDRRQRIEVGYGLEHLVTDAVASNIVDRILIPNIREGNQNEGIARAVSHIISIISGEGEVRSQEPGSGSGNKTRRISPGGGILTGLLVIFFIFLLITNPRLAIHLLLIIMSGRSGRGGFSGGGGRSGGGGASGSW